MTDALSRELAAVLCASRLPVATTTVKPRAASQRRTGLLMTPRGARAGACRSTNVLTPECDGRSRFGRGQPPQVWWNLRL